MPSCEPSDLIEASKCFKCIPTGMQSEVIIYLLNEISGLNLTPQQLMDAAACYKCIPTGMQSEVQTYLLCAIADAAGA
jgi:hypothetical protein